MAKMMARHRRAHDEVVDVERGLYTAPSGVLGAGKGLFTDHVIRKGVLIVPYEGEVLTRAEYLERYPNEDAIYVVQFSKNRYVDARNPARSSIARFANSLPRSAANAELTPRGNIKAKKFIPPNAEIFITYGNQFHIK